jgi:glycosyltransferase involved in cell wall biosynthesis
MCLPVLGSQPTVFTTHGLNLLGDPATRSAPAGAGLRRALGRGVQAIAISASDRDALLRVAPAFADSITLIPHGVEVEPGVTGNRSAVREEWRISDSTLALLFVGELAEHKQPLQLTEAIRCARGRGADVEGLLVGEGRLRRDLENATDGAISLLGERDDVGTLQSAADAFVLPSLHEGLSLALLEAMASGLPVIASEIPSNREVVGEAGILVPPGDASALCEAIVQLAADHELRSRLGEAARRRVADRFSLERMLRETGELYDRMLEPSG